MRIKGISYDDSGGTRVYKVVQDEPAPLDGDNAAAPVGSNRLTDDCSIWQVK